MSRTTATTVPTTAVTITAKTVIPLIDPTFRGGLIDVPYAKTSDTKGRSDWIKGLAQKELSLCCLFQRGRCSLQERCHQVHVDPTYVAAVRQQNAHVISCCRRCKDTASLNSTAISFFASFFPNLEASRVTVNVAPNVDRAVPADLLAFTIGLESWLTEDPNHNTNTIATVIPARKICRLHLGARCKYGKDCKYIHLCCNLGEGFLSADAKVPLAPSSSVTNAAVGSFSVKAGSTPLLPASSSTKPAVPSVNAAPWRPTTAASAVMTPPRSTNANTGARIAIPDVTMSPYHQKQQQQGAAFPAFFDRVNVDGASSNKSFPLTASSSADTTSSSSSRRSSIEQQPAAATTTTVVAPAAPEEVAPRPIPSFAVPTTTVVNDAKERSALYPTAATAAGGSKSNSSSMLDRSIPLTGLCFDPTMLMTFDHLDVESPMAAPSTTKASGSVGYRADVFGASIEMMSGPVSTTASEAAALSSAWGVPKQAAFLPRNLRA